jgi:2,3-bisphosphoglycerate-independent phosphoglycerate mutase
MKYAIIIPDGCADEPQESLGGKTPLEAASLPAMDAVVKSGCIASGNHTPAALPAGSDTANLSLLGYDPLRYYTGRAPLEAAAQGISLAPGDWAVRCNMVTIEDQTMRDFTAGHVSTEEAAALLASLQEKVGSDAVRFLPGVSYRNLLLVKSAAFTADTRTLPPHDFTDQSIHDAYPRGPVHGVRGAMITAVDLLRGLAQLIGWKRIDVPGATGYLDTDYAAKGRAAVAALKDFDLVCVHIEATDEASHEGRADAKIEALQQIDQHIVAPVFAALQTYPEWRIMVSPDHPTPLRTKTPTTIRPPRGQSCTFQKAGR